MTGTVTFQVFLHYLVIPILHGMLTIATLITSALSPEIGSHQTNSHGTKTSTTAGEPASSTKSISFQGMTWEYECDSMVSIVEHRDHEALQIESGQSVVALMTSPFTEGRLEFDLAFKDRIPPWICFNVNDHQSSQRLMLNPWAKTMSSNQDRLCQAILSKTSDTTLVVNYLTRKEPYDTRNWVHLAIVIENELCKIYVDNDEAPVVSIHSPFDGGTIGLRGTGLIRNLHIM